MPPLDRRHFLGTAALSLAGGVTLQATPNRSSPEPALPSSEWHHPQRDPGNTASTTDPGPQLEGEICWETTVRSGSSENFAGFARLGDALLVSADRKLIALDTDTGDRLWDITASERMHGLESSPRVRDTTVFLAFGGIYVYAISLETRRPRWRYRTNGSIHAMTLAGNTLCFNSYVDGAHRTIALDTETGSERWRSPGDWYETAVSDNLVVTKRRQTDDFELVAIDLERGTEEWTRQFDDVPLPSGTGLVGLEDAIVVTGPHGGAVLEPATGDVRTTLEGVSGWSLAVDPDTERVYTVDSPNGVVHCVDLDGSSRWSVEADLESGITVGGDTVYVATPDGLLAVDALDGDRRFAVSSVRRSNNWTTTTPLVDAESVYHRIGDTVYGVCRP
ncbi:PQQ-binding-like beta-propeller repeat protein [Halomontanus rarus]|uniref:outer membrane protein assembly factor BamB family protein n=1 Tax=Halomontanus rarus TaxID=3034020 RepID=UPI001A989850